MPSILSTNGEANISVVEDQSGTHCTADSELVSSGICQEKRAHTSNDGSPELPAGELAGSLRKSVMEAMQILSPMQDLAIWHMHADLCLSQMSASSDPCNVSSIFNATSWLAAFAWVALWRC